MLASPLHQDVFSYSTPSQLLAQLEETTHNMPALQPQHLARFTQLYTERFGIHLEPAQALEQLTHLLIIVRYKQLNSFYHQQREASNPSPDP